MPGSTDDEHVLHLLASLTPREWEVLDLLGQALANKVVADRLGVTSRTVETHVEHVLAKLGVVSRWEAGRLYLLALPKIRRITDAKARRHA